MLKNYLKIAWRGIVAKKTYATLNIMGLTIGLSCGILCLLWIQDEARIDSFHTNADHLYVVYERAVNNDEVKGAYFTQGLLAQELKASIQEIKHACTYQKLASSTFETRDQIIKMEGSVVSNDFLKMFSYKVIQGNFKDALTDPSSIAISKRMATALFGSVDKALGEMVRFENRKDFLISAVFEDVQSNSSLQFDFLLNWEWYIKEVTWLNEWIYRQPLTFIELHPGVDVDALQGKLKNFVKPFLEKSPSSFYLEVGLQPFDKKYLFSKFNNGIPDGGRIEYVRIFSIVAIFLILIACINFINLSTARTLKRAKEIGIRKAVGANRLSLSIQLMTEIIVLILVSIVISVSLIILILPFFNALIDKEITFPFTDLSFWFFVILITVIISFVAGGYPSFFLSSLNPIKALKGTITFNQKLMLLRKSLVSLQFILSIVIISGAVIISKQLQYIQTKNLGYDKHNLVYIPLQGEMSKKYETFKQLASNIEGVVNVTRSVQRPTNTTLHVYNLDWPGKPVDMRGIAVHNGVDYNFLEALNLKLINGRNFSQERPSDSTSYIINETALRMLGVEDPIGLPLTFFDHKGEIVGVVQDFNLTSLYTPIEPLVLFLYEPDVMEGFILVKLEDNKIQQSLAELQELYTKIEPNFLFSYEFAEDHQAQQYKQEELADTFTKYFAVIAILITSIGLFGLSMFTVEQRTKEIGIRKVLGSGNSNIFLTLSKDFIYLIIIATIVAAPLSYFIMAKWLNQYTFRIDLNLLFFLIPILIITITTFITIGYQLVRASRINPITILKAE
jgi:ABC-type antimicrobial peptide transport system permease subunit